MAVNEKFCLRWNDFENNINSAFNELRDEKDFLDVTIACGDDQIQAHKVILSACSPFFKTILRRNPHQHPLLYLHGVSYTDLQSVLNFMYHGEVNVAQEELNSFLAVAENLKVKGLTQQSKSDEKPLRQRHIPTNTSAAQTPVVKENKLPQHRTPLAQNTSKNITSSAAVEQDDVQAIVPIKSEPKDIPLPSPVAPYSKPAYSYPQQPSSTLATADDETLEYTEDVYDDYGEYPEQYSGEATSYNAGNVGSTAGYEFQDPGELLQFVRKAPADNRFYCTFCDKYSHRASYHTRNHVEAHHFPNMFSYPCDQCEQTFSTKSNYSMHRSRKHRPVKE